MPPEPILSASVPRYKRHCCSFNSFRKISYCCCVVIPSLYHISPSFGSYLRMSPKGIHEPVLLPKDYSRGESQHLHRHAVYSTEVKMRCIMRGRTPSREFTS